MVWISFVGFLITVAISELHVMVSELQFNCEIQNRETGLSWTTFGNRIVENK